MFQRMQFFCQKIPGGLALLAESPELVGAESFVLSNCRSLEVAQKFLMMQLGFTKDDSRIQPWWLEGL